MEKLSVNKRKFIASLSTAKRRRSEGLFVVEGGKSILDNIGGFDFRMIVARHEWMERHAAMFSRSTELFEASSADMERISSLSSAPDALAVCAIPQVSFSLSELKGKLSIALDGIQDPGNLGTIIRTADWFGIDTILCSHGTVDVFNPKVIQSSMGSLSRVKVFYADLHEVISNIEVPVYGTFLHGDNLYKADLNANALIVMGNEGNGISHDLEMLIRHRLTIPSFVQKSSAHVESLNVSIATALICGEFRRRSLMEK